MFITLEGIEGSGKTSQVENIVAFLKTRGYECVTTREPGGTPIGSRIRAILLDPDNNRLEAGAELLLYMADRIQHIRTFIAPHLALGLAVVCDRFFDATLVYQGYARGLDKNLIRDLHSRLCDGIQPDATLLLDLDPAVGLARAWKQIHKGGRPDLESRFEQQKIAFHQKVRDGYLDIARREPQRIRVIDARQTPAAVKRAIEEALTPLVPVRRR